MKPSDALRRGLCPSCGGRGTVHKILTGDDGPCNTCDGIGYHPPAHALVEDNDVGVMAIIYGEKIGHRENCAKVQSQRRMLNERRAHRRERGPLFSSASQLEEFMAKRDACTCGGIEI